MLSYGRLRFTIKLYLFEIKVINPAAQRLFGFKEKELLNKPINTIIAAKKLDKKENFRTNFSLEEEVKIDLTKDLQGT